MWPFILSYLFGTVQMLLTAQLIYAVNKRNKLYILIFFAVKFLLYGIFVSIVISNYILDIALFLCGFLAGAPTAAIGWYIYRMLTKK